MANSATGSERDLSNSKEQLLSTLSLSDTENDEDRKWRHSNESKPIRRVEHNDPAILSYGGFSQRFVASQETVATSQDVGLMNVTLSKKDRSDSPNLSTSEPDVRSILRYSRESLLTLRDSELSKRKPVYLGRAWVRIGVTSEERENRSRDDNDSASNYSSNTSLANTSSSSYLLPSFACKRRIPGSSQSSSSTEIKRNTALTPKKEESSSSLTGRRSISNSRNSNSTEDEDPRPGDRSMFRRQNEYARNANESRRIGSGRIPMRDSWDDPKYSRPNAGEFPSKSSTGDPSSSPTNSASSATTSTTAATSKTEQSKTSESSNDFNLRPGGGLLGLRDRQRENEQPQIQSTILPQSSILPSRTILGNNSILDKDSRSDFRERSVLGDDRYDRNERNDRLDRNDHRMDRNDRMDRIDRNDRSDRNDRMDRNDRGDRRFNRDRDYGRYNDDMPRNSMSRYNHGDRMNSYSQYSFSSNDNRGRRQYNDRNAEEPEWFSGGPTSQNDTIELRGFEEYTSGRHDSTSSRNSVDGDDGKATADYESDGEKANEDTDKSNDNNNNDNKNSSGGGGGGANDEAANRDANTEKSSDYEPEDIEVANAEPKANKKDDNFNIEDFLKAENLNDFLTGGDSFIESGSGESRFSRWFRPSADEPKPNQATTEKPTEPNHNENGEKNVFAPFTMEPGNVGDTNAAQNTFLEFLQRGKFAANMQKPPGPPLNLIQQMMMENNNLQQQQQQQPQPDFQPPPHHQQQQQQQQPPMMSNHGPLSVEELEARLRQSGPPSAGNSSNNIPNDVSNMKNSQQQDMIAFKKLLQQISGEQPQPSPPQQQPHQQPKMFPFGPVPPPQAQNQQPRQLIPHPEAIKKMLSGHGPFPVPLITAQQRMEIIKRPETQVLIQRLRNGELNQGFLIQQLSNPQINQRDREILFAVLSYFNPAAQPSPPENNMPHPVPHPNDLPVPNANMQPPQPPPNMQTPNNAALSPDMLRQLYLQAAVTGPKQQLRISPLPNGIPQRIPSPRELQFHTQSIMQNALIKKKLEEQRENFRKRQEQQQQQQSHMNPNLASNSNGIIENLHDGSMNNQQMNRGVSPNSSAALKQLNQNQHTSSPTPTLAFTPTSVLRKMTAEKDMDNSTNPANINNKDMNKKLLDAHLRQCDSEYHMLKLAENELSKSENLKADVKKELIDLDEQNHRIEKDMNRLNEKIDSLGIDMQWMKNALIEWAQAIDHDDQTNALIEKYCKEDKKRAEAFEVRRQAVQKLIIKNKNRLMELESEKQSLEHVLERTSDLYKQEIIERRQMTSTWSAAVQSLHARNTSIRETMKKITQAKFLGDRKSIELKEQSEFLNQQIQNNKESELMIAELNEQISKVKILLNQHTDEIQLKINDLITLKRQMQHNTNCLQQMRQKNHKASIEYDTKSKQIAKLKEIVDILVSKVGKIQDEKNNSDYRLKHLDELFEDEEKSIHTIELEMVRLSQMVYRSSQIIQQQHEEQKLIETEIHTLESSIKAISANFLNQEKELARQLEIQYDIHFKTIKMEYRLAKMQGKLKELDPELIEKNETLQLLCSKTREKRDRVKRDLSSAEETERRLKPLLLENQTEHVELMNKLRNRQSECEVGKRLIGTNREKLHEHLVEHSLLRMRVHQIAEMYNKQMEKFYNLEQHKLQLQLAVDERLIDLRCQMDLLATKRKHLRAERDQLKADINARKIKIDALKARFELTNELLGKNEDGTTISAIQLKMETAQEKQLLLLQGSTLNEQVLNAEADIKALENTLILLNFSNDKYKRKMGQAQDNEEFNEKMQKLSNEYATALTRLKVAKNDFENGTKKLNELQRQFEHYETELDEIARNRLENNDALIKIHKEIMDQNSKVERAKRELKIARKAMMKRAGDREYVQLLEKDLTTKEMETRNTTALHQLADMIDAIPGMSLVITKLLYEKGLEIPMHNQSNRESVCLSRARSRASMRSSGRASECSLTINSREDDGIISRLSEHSFITTSSSVSKTSIKSAKKSEKSVTSTSSSLNFQIEGQSIRNDFKSTKP